MGLSFCKFFCFAPFFYFFIESTSKCNIKNNV